MTDKQWMDAHQDRLAAVLASGELPMIARFLAQDTPFDLASCWISASSAFLTAWRRS
jgi:hypothetical protein